ncbi:hypothetical protein V6N12_066556 [Hibiscus sabdariffa]|uniref:Reverse transcriptase zinc-binding domain-containing protein n=1 Tax=Hibiscus sabdariffa TaxID=183260 RepID=A0ABR2CQH3_9ROSI
MLGINSVCSLRLNLLVSGDDCIWKSIHKSRTLPRIKSFLWLVCKDRVLTNAERLRRHNIANTTECVCCGARVEDLDHLLCQCPFAKEVWEPRVFDPNDLQHESVESCSQRIVDEVCRDASLTSLGRMLVIRQRSRSDVWKPPASNRVKLNIDGARRTSDDTASCEGVFLDSSGTWVTGFSKYVGKCSALEVEFWAIFESILHFLNILVLC